MRVNRVALYLLIADLIVVNVCGIVVYRKLDPRLNKRSRPGTAIDFYIYAASFSFKTIFNVNDKFFSISENIGLYRTFERINVYC